MKKFISKVLSDEGYPCAWTLSDKRNHMFKTKDELIDFIGDIDKNETVYFALSTYTDYSENESKGYRVTTKVNKYRTLFTEIDIREGENHYHTNHDALNGIERFCNRLHLPLPTIVATGGGYHVYWILNEDVNLDQWRVWSNSIIKVANREGLLIDIAGTNKPTQIFRPPNTFNFKYEPPFKVKVESMQPTVSYSDIMSKLEKYISDNELDVRVTTIAKEVNTNIELRDFNPIVQQCEQIAKSPYGSEEHWRGMLTIARLCKDGHNHAHELSALDKRYDANDTDRKLEILSQQMDGTDGMPFTCDKFNEINPSICDGCPHKGIKSPIVLGIIDVALTETQVTDVSELATFEGEVVIPKKKQPDEVTFHTPDGGRFKVSKEGLVMKEAKEVDGEIEWVEVVICKQRIYPIGVIVDKDGNGNTVYSYLWRIELEDGRRNDAIIPAETFITPSTLLAVFSNLGVNVVQASHFKPFAQAMRAFINSVRDKIPPISVHRSLGWKKNEFVIGSTTIDMDNNPRRSILNEEMETLTNDVMCEEGTLEGWQDAVSPYARKEMILEQSVLATAFGAPLIKFGSINGFIYSLQGESGCGKSTMQKVAASVWGDPSAQLQNSVGTKTGDTIISVTRWIGGLNNLPIHLEELSNMTDQDASDLAYMITQGAEKNRMQGLKNGGFKRSVGLTWSTIVTASTNDSLGDKISRYKVDSHAELMRILEIRNIPPIVDDWYEVGTKLELIHQNYGHAGIEYARYIHANKANLKSWLGDYVDEINKDLNTSSPERFWVQGIASMLLGASIALKLGIFEFDMIALREFLYNQIESHRVMTRDEATSSQSLFADMMNELLSETLIVRGSEITGVKYDVIRLPMSRLSMRVDVSSGKMYISATALKQYGVSKKISPHLITESAIKEGFTLESNGKRIRLGGGIGDLDSSTQTRCIVLGIPQDKVNDIVES